MDEEQAESVDSGCVPDLTLEGNWHEVDTILGDEHYFTLGLLRRSLDNKPNEKKPSVTGSQNSKEKEGKKNIQVIDQPKHRKGKKWQSNQPANPWNSKNDKKKKSNETTDWQKNKNNKQKKSIQVAYQQNSKYDPRQNKSVMDMTAYELKADKLQLQQELRKFNRNEFQDLDCYKAKKLRKKLQLRLQKIEKHLKVQQKKRDDKFHEAFNKCSARDRQSAKGTKAIYNQSGKLVFSKFDFSNSAEEKLEKRKPDLNYCLSKILKEKEKITALKDQGKVNDAISFMEKKAWDRAMKKAHGEKIKDSSEKIVRSMHKKKFKKKKSQEAWNERERMVEKRKEQRQEKRKNNIASRKQKKIHSKGSKWKTKGNDRVPGF